MAIVNKVLLWVNSFFLCFLIALFVFNFYAFDKNFYEKEFEKNNVYGKIGYADLLGNDLRAYFYESDAELKYSDYYSQRELTHLQDVKALFQKAIFLLYLVSIIFILLFMVQYFLHQRLIKTVLLGSIITLVVSSLLSIIALSFESSFETFHRLIFSNDLWMLPYDSTLITLFPQQFFADFLTHFIITRLFIGFVLLIVSLSVIYRKEIIKYIKSKIRNSKR